MFRVTWFVSSAAGFGRRRVWANDKLNALRFAERVNGVVHTELFGEWVEVV